MTKKRCRPLTDLTTYRTVFCKPQGLYGGTDLRSLSPQPQTSLHCQTMDLGLVLHVVYLFTPQLLLVLTKGWPGWVDLDG